MITGKASNAQNTVIPTSGWIAGIIIKIGIKKNHVIEIIILTKMLILLVKHKRYSCLILYPSSFKQVGSADKV